MWLDKFISLLVKSLLHFYWLALAAGVSFTASADYSKLVLDEKPVAYWPFNKSNDANVANLGSIGTTAHGIATGKIFFNQAGPRPSEFPLFDSANSAISLNQKNSFIRIKSTPENPLAFKLGDTITIE